MVWCNACIKNITQTDVQDGKICCPDCGRVIDEDNYSSEPTFTKNAAGQSQLSGNYVRTVQSDKVSRERTLNEAYHGIESIRFALGIDGGDSIVNPALAFYTIALEKNFTRGRRKEQVEAACLYIACRQFNKPFLLIDFSEHLRINVYILGAVFLQLCLVLSLQQHPLVQKPVDPCLFIHRFTDRLFGGKKHIARTALHIVASMKRDWMTTGRKPSGVCGAALYIAALSHGLSCSKSDIIKVVRICEATLTKRLIEFENTESGSLTIDEFNTRAEQLEKEERLTPKFYEGSKGSGITEVLCEHQGSVEVPFAHGLCESCFTDFLKLSGGLDGGSEPPAFQRAERERLMAEQAAVENAEDPNFHMLSNQVENNGGEYLEVNNGGEYSEPEKGGNPKNVTGSKNVEISGSELIGAKTENNATPDTLHSMDGKSPDDDNGESETFSDIDDEEVEGYLHNEQEKVFKKIIWEKMNREFLEEQAAKEAAALAAKKANEAILANCSEDQQKLAAAAASAAAKSRKEKQQKRAAELKSLGPAQTAAEATKQMLTRKRLSSKINYDALEKLFDNSEEKTKKSRNVDNDGEVKSIKADPEEDATYEEDIGEDVQYDEDIRYDDEDARGYDNDYDEW